MKEVRYNLIFRPEPEGGFTVIVPAFPGCITYGKNLAEARRMALDAIKGYMVSLRKHREPIPSTVPFHTKDLPKGTLISILNQAGIGRENLT